MKKELNDYLEKAMINENIVKDFDPKSNSKEDVVGAIKSAFGTNNKTPEELSQLADTIIKEIKDKYNGKVRIKLSPKFSDSNGYVLEGDKKATPKLAGDIVKTIPKAL